jgi:glucose-6-phosphate isomerase
LREGVPNFFATFIEVLKSRDGKPLEVDNGVTIGDYLSGFLYGTRRALHDNGRQSITVTVPDVNATTVGQLIALFERAVGFYAHLVGINAYHQPGVEAGKKAAAALLDLQSRAIHSLESQPGSALTAEEIAHQIGAPEEVESVYHILKHLSANARIAGGKGAPDSATFSVR